MHKRDSQLLLVFPSGCSMLSANQGKLLTQKGSIKPSGYRCQNASAKIFYLSFFWFFFKIPHLLCMAYYAKLYILGQYNDSIFRFFVKKASIEILTCLV